MRIKIVRYFVVKQLDHANYLKYLQSLKMPLQYCY